MSWYEARNLWRRSQLDYRVALKFCRSLILRMGVFLCFAGTNLRDWEKLVFSCRELIFAIFRKSSFTWNYSVLEYKQSNTGEQDADVKNVNQLINGVPSVDPFR